MIYANARLKKQDYIDQTMNALLGESAMQYANHGFHCSM